MDTDAPARSAPPRPVPPPPALSATPVRPLIEARDLTRLWGRGAAAQVGVAEVDLDVGRGELVAVVGPSGSGKSTLGALLAGLDTPSSGSLVIDGARIDGLRRDELAEWRGATVGIVFQDFHLLPTLTAGENVELALELSGHHPQRRGRRRVALDALARVGLADKAKRLPAQLSGGEQQRVGIARAVVTQPLLIVADEPTGSLDRASGQMAFELLAGLTHTGTTVVLITHDLTLAAAAHRVVTMIDGRVAVRGGAR